MNTLLINCVCVCVCVCVLVAQSCLTLSDPTNCSMPGFPALHYLLELLKLMSIESMMPSSHLILCHSFPSCPQSFSASGSFPVSQFFASGGQSIAASASASVLPKKYPGLISLKIDWFDLLVVQGIFQESSQALQFKSINYSVLSLHYGLILTSIND